MRFRSLGPQPLWQSKLCFRTAQENYVLDRAFALIEGHPGRSDVVGYPKSDLFDLHNIMCKTLHMATNLALDDKLIEEAQRSGKHKTKKEAVTAALEEYVRRRKQLRILDAFGSFEFDPDYDYKAERRKRRS